MRKGMIILYKAKQEVEGAYMYLTGSGMESQRACAKILAAIEKRYEAEYANPR